MPYISWLRRGALGLALCAALPAAPIQWTAAMGGNDNWYEYIPTVSIFESIDYDTARAASLGSTHMGMQGYLATVTSAPEQAFIEAFPILVGFGNTGSAWLGATTLSSPGTYRWVDGPEAGQAITYTNWLPSQPVAGWEYLAQLRNLNTGATNGWVSLTAGNRTFGYVIEYGDATIDQPAPAGGQVPEPASVTLAGAGLLGAALLLRRQD
ncbi:MAG: PEP-CTERM sorting domain-containing protein [Bryobacterales bacterium]|nr:PEP-CTERM sorting domain-containing protein [Bryobacterales bacterium]